LICHPDVGTVEGYAARIASHRVGTYHGSGTGKQRSNAIAANIRYPEVGSVEGYTGGAASLGVGLGVPLQQRRADTASNPRRVSLAALVDQLDQWASGALRTLGTLCSLRSSRTLCSRLALGSSGTLWPNRADSYVKRRCAGGAICNR